MALTCASGADTAAIAPDPPASSMKRPLASEMVYSSSSLNTLAAHKATYSP